MDEGFVKLYRKFEHWEWFTRSNMVHFFVFLLLRATHKDTRYMGHELKRGQLVFGLNSAKKATGLSIQNMRSCLTLLKSTEEVTVWSTHRFSIITIANYEKYQERSTDYPTRKVTRNQHATNNIQEVKNVKNIITQPKKQVACNPLFWEFKKLYPKCYNFKKTQSLFEALNVTDELWGVMRSAIVSQMGSQQWKAEGGKYIPASYTWLEGERWKDTLDVAKPSKQSVWDTAKVLQQ